MTDVYKFQFKADILTREIEDALFWAVFNAESVFGKAKVRLDGSFDLDRHKKTCVIEGSTDVGQHIAKIFTSLAAKKFGEEAFSVERMPQKEGPNHEHP
jgi:hypothetical protein